jgi:glycosyltransferase involved in cell wall biosynthesis
VVIKKHFLALSWCMPPMVAPQSTTVSRILAVLSAKGWEIEVLAGDLPPDERAHYVWDDLLADRYRNSFTVRSLSYGDAEPSAALSWEEAAEKVALASIQTRPPHALITFAQPFSDHAIGLKIKSAFPDLPWIAHFSDPWVDNVYASPSRSDRRLERKVIEQADAIAFITGRTRDLVMRKYPAEWNEKTFIIPHGYEGDPVTRSTLAPGPLHLVHTGGIYGKRVPYVFLDALAALRRESFDARVTFVGPVDSSFRQRADELGAGIKFIPPTTPEEAARYANEADTLLLFDAPANESVFLPSKLVDYLPLGLPILAMTPLNGSSADVLRETGGLIVDPADMASQIDALRRLAVMKTQGTLLSLVPSVPAAERYAIGETTLVFEQLLDRYAVKDTVPVYEKKIRRFCLKNALARIGLHLS